MNDRNTRISRDSIKPSVRERVWGRAAARCVLCSKWLIDERQFWHAIPVGQLAHNVAATNGENSPRGDSAKPRVERNAESNLLLLCNDCHRTIDSSTYRDKFTVDFLTEKKAEHERRVREVTNFATLRPSTVIRLTAAVRGTVGPATDEQVSEALRHSGLTGMGADTRTGVFDIDLRYDENDPWVWDASKKQIDAAVARAQEAVAAQDTGVLAVFAIAPIPTLAYLGAALDDKTETRLFQRRRDDSVDAWSWTLDRPSASTFESSVPDNADETASDVVAFIEVTGPIESSRLHDDLRLMPAARLRAATGMGSDAIGSPADLAAFGSAWRGLLADIELHYPRATRIHVVAAVPVTAAIALGRHRMRAAHPAFVVYQRIGDTYIPGMEINE